MDSHNLETIGHSISALTEHFNVRMAEFQQAIQTSVSASSPSSSVAAQFDAFRLFVITSLESLQLQVQVLSKQCDLMEMRSRRKMLLVHGIPEAHKESVSSTVVKTLSEHFDVPELTVANIRYCKRLGQLKDGKARAIIVKFSDLSLRNKVWFTKTRLKGTGITLSEFLTKERHEAFKAARQKFGISRCWTRDGFITALGPDDKRHRVNSIADVKMIGSKASVIPVLKTTCTATSCISPVVSQTSAMPGPSNTGVPGLRSVRVQAASKAKKDVRK